MAEYSLSVIIPTFNETDNIENIIIAVFDVLDRSFIKGEILVVDDGSEDGTTDIVKKLQDRYPRLSLIVRDKDHGLSRSVAEGFANSTADVIQVIYPDFSHPVELIPDFYHEIKDCGCDVVIGSRYKKGEHLQKRPLKHRMISLGATLFGRILFPEITDPLSGFFAVKKEVLKDAPLKPGAYKILMEVLGKGKWESFKEIPFTVRNDEEKKIGLSTRSTAEYICQCIDIGLYAFGHRRTHVWKEWEKIFKFGIVGISGIFVNTGLLYALTEYAGLYYLVSSVFATETSIITNFLLNDHWTFNQNKNSRVAKKWKRFVSYQTVSVIGVFINMVILYLLTEYGNLWYILSNIIGIFIVFIWNFFVNRNLTWRMD